MPDFQVGDEVEALPCDSRHDHCVVTGRRGTVVVAAMDAGEVGVSFPGLCGNNLYGDITANTGWACNPSWLRHVPQDLREAPRFEVGDRVVLGSEERGKVTRVRTEPRYDVETSKGVGEYIRERELRLDCVSYSLAPDGQRREAPPDLQWRCVDRLGADQFGDLLLTEAQRKAASDRGACSGRADWLEEAERAVAFAQAEKVLRRIVALLRERVKAPQGGADYWLDGDDLADELEGLLRLGKGKLG